MASQKRTVCITRECTECDGSGEVEFEIDVDGEYEKADPDVGIMSGGYVVNGATYKGKPFDLTDDEIDTITEDAEQEYSDGADEADSEPDEE